ncbi:protein STRUBBELIG-RECEPTOR FAMILY 3-like isoform X2 [Rutidosis leptorrhynchoides]|uniref:protein STRUBBELIG-RECEPTOR FAMILY 3-like isoform X2 n=1 Tax=Rutidosis leptorrhynchoides TaxID=125765 RepID=UPI003A9A1378
MGVDRCIIYLVVLLEILACSLVTATDLSDVIAINNLYGALKSPPLHGWRPSAGDPCGESWQGVICDATNTHIMSITVHGTNLGGELGDSLGAFSSLQSIDLSNNAIRGSFPAYLPVTIINLDLSCNFLSGQLPSSLASLSSLRTFQLQNNQLSGTLHVLQDLLLHDL